MSRYLYLLFDPSLNDIPNKQRCKIGIGDFIPAQFDIYYQLYAAVKWQDIQQETLEHYEFKCLMSSQSYANNKLKNSEFRVGIKAMDLWTIILQCLNSLDSKHEKVSKDNLFDEKKYFNYLNQNQGKDSITENIVTANSII